MEITPDETIQAPSPDTEGLTPEKLLAMALFPELYDQATPNRILGSPFVLAGRLASLIFTAGSVTGAGIQPEVREIMARANMHNPNAIPGPSDLVRFELREVFREADRAAQLSETPSETFLKIMEESGYSRFWAESYWAAHWDLPSATQGYEMLQRLRPGRVPANMTFTDADLKALLKKQDVLPAYRDRLAAISYTSLTRVDIRRLYHLGVITLPEVAERYMDTGYNASDAAMLAELTKRDYDPEDKALTLSQLVQGYHEGVVDDATLSIELHQLGYADGAREVLIRTQSAIRQRREAKERAKLNLQIQHLRLATRRQSRAGKLDEESLRLQLADIGMAPGDIEIFIGLNVLTPIPREADLSKADILSAVHKGTLGELAATTKLHAIGFDAEEIGVLLSSALHVAAKKDAKAKQKDLSLAQIRHAIKTGSVTVYDGTKRLMAQGYDAEEAAILLEGYGTN